MFRENKEEFVMRKISSILTILCCLLFFLSGCTSKPTADNEVDYSTYEFAGKQWIRDAEHDLETLCFLPNGEFHYSCACGNPVNDSDMVESYSYDDTTKMFTLNCYEELEGMITEIELISCDGETLELDFDGEKRVFYIEGTQSENIENTETSKETFPIDLTKVSPMIRENVNEDVVVAAQAVIETFLQYENSVAIEVSGNSQRFLNDMSYVIHCTCPSFGAFTDFNEMSSYDASTGTVSWNYFVERDEFDSKMQSFYDTTENYLSNVEPTDSEAMRAMVLYYAVIDDLVYDYDLIGDNYNNLSKEEANLKGSSYHTLVEKSGICTNIAQAYMFLCTQADISCGTVLHMGGSGMHMWNIVQIDGKYYYCDPTWDANTSLTYFGITAADRASWAGEYSAEEGTMLSATIPEKYEISDSRFDILREKLPVEISELQINKELQTISFVGYDYEFIFECK